MSPSGRYGNPGNVGAEVEVVRAIYAAFARRDLSTMQELVHEDVVLHLSATGRMSGRTGPYIGVEGVREYLADVDRVWEQLTLHADDVRAVACSVVVFGHVDGRTDGRRVDRRVVWTWQVRDGRALSVRADDLGPGQAPGAT
ncbi:MAG: nuclear transport factor 2 family protein [Solirubrobacteraceae bacterium]